MILRSQQVNSFVSTEFYYLNLQMHTDIYKCVYHTQSLQEGLCVCLCAHFVLQRGHTICHVERNHSGLTFSNSAQCSPVDTHVDVGPASTHIIKDTHTHTPTLFPGDWLSSCLSDIFFFFLISATLPAGHVCDIVCICVYLSCVCLPVCVLSLGKCLNSSYIFTALQGFTKE